MQNQKTWLAGKNLSAKIVGILLDQGIYSEATRPLDYRSRSSIASYDAIDYRR